MELEFALFAAVDCGDLAAAARLLAASPSAIREQFHGATALHRAAARGDVAMLALLFEHGARLEEPDDRGATALAWASEENRDDAVDWLLARGAVAGALELAARGKNSELARALDEFPWSLDQRGTQGTPLLAAVRRGKTDTVELLLARGADPTERDDEGLSASELARRSGDPRIVAMLEQASSRHGSSAEDSASVSEALSYRCGACAEEIVIEVDRTEGEEQRFVEDCPVCCRANVIDVQFERGAGAARAELE